MTATVASVAGDGPRPRCEISLWKLQESLATLAKELAEVARKFDEAACEQGNAQASIEAMAPREYFASLLELRRMRERYFGNELFGEPAWDILLELMLARIDGREVLAGEIKSHSSSPNIVTRHYLDALVEAKLVEILDNAANSDDPYLALSSEAARRMAELYRARTRG